jgi:hypothetical protein
MAGRNGVVINDQYFSGVQSSVFIGDVWVDDIVSLDYSVDHSRNPVYGYGSQHFDFLPKGRILVTGTFTINFREPNYLWMILARYKTFQNDEIADSKAALDAQKAADITTKELETFPSDPRKNFDLFMAQNTSNSQAVARELNNALTTKTSRVRKPERFNHGIFAITVGYGSDLSEAVGERINYVQIMGKSKVIMADGRPVQEQYSFIARDIS